MKRIVLPLMAAVIATLCYPVHGQHSGRIKEPTSPPAVQEASQHITYDSLAVRRNEMITEEARIKSRLDEARKAYAENTPDKGNIATKIIELEKSLYDIRNSLDSLIARMTVMEQQQGYSLPILNTGYITSDTGSTMLVDNNYFRDNLTQSDYRQLLDAQNAETKVSVMVQTIQQNYAHLASLVNEYGKASKGPYADSLYSAIKTIQAENIHLASELGTEWSKVFDTKVYAYNYILDKNNETELLILQEEQMNNLRLLETEIRGEYMYDALAVYALQKLFLTKYETRLADLANLTEAADSLGSLIPPTSHINDFFVPSLNTEERIFYDFIDAQIIKPSRYTSSSQIKTVEIFPRGSMYRILLGAYTKPQPVSIFRSVYPLFREVKGDKKNYYYTGGYATFEEATAAAARLKKAGFRNPRVVAWHNGIYDPAPGTGDTPVTGTRPNTKIRYRVEINGAGESLSGAVRDVIFTQAAGKEISRITSPDTGEPLFVVGAFNNKALAEALVNGIGAIDPTLTLRVVEIK